MRNLFFMRHHLECPSSFSFAYIQWGSSGQRMVLRKLNIPLQVKEWTCDCVCSTNPVEAHENNPAFVKLLSATSLNGISLHHSPSTRFGAFYRNERTVSHSHLLKALGINGRSLHEKAFRSRLVMCGNRPCYTSLKRPLK